MKFSLICYRKKGRELFMTNEDFTKYIKLRTVIVIENN